jgi:pre-rRNA-processing protein RIX1
VKTTFRVYLAPTASDKLAVPQSLRVASRQLLVMQHHTTPKNGNADEWIKAIAGFLKASHVTADQVFRAVQESWESNSGYTRTAVDYDEDPQGGSDLADDLPPWTGVSSGAERLVGLVETIAESLRCPTRTPVAMPVSSFLDLTARISMVLPPKKGSRGQDGTQLNSAIGREEKDELWSGLPDIHIAAIDLLTALIQRLGDGAVPIAADVLLQAVRIIDANQHIPLVRERGYVLLRLLLLAYGPTMPKFSVNSLNRIVQGCCRDLLLASGHTAPKPPGGSDAQKHAGNNKPAQARASTNADAYLSTENKADSTCCDLAATHIEAASALLETLLSHLPQQHLKQTLRALIDRTAILSHNRDAMVSSILNPYRTHTGKALPSVFPFLARDFPRDQAVEVLRSNLRVVPGPSTINVEGGDDEAVLAQLQGMGGDQEVVDDDEAAAGEKGGWGNGWTADKAGDEEIVDAAPAPPAGFDLAWKAGASAVTTNEETITAVSETVAGGAKQTVMLSSTLKRKSEELEEPPAKRIDTGKAPEVFGGPAGGVEAKMDVDEGGADDSDSDSDGSVHLNAALDDDSDEEEE